MKPLVLVHGTWSRANPWHLPGSLIRRMAYEAGFDVHDFLWSGGLYGVPSGLPGDPAEAANGANDGMLLPWLDAGEKLALYIASLNLPAGPLYVLSHSHGLQVVAYSAIRGASYATAVSVSGPVRRDMLRARRAAKARIGRWVQFTDPTGHDTIIVDGEYYDGGGLQGAVFDLPEGETRYTPGTGHSGALTNEGWLAAILHTF